MAARPTIGTVKALFALSCNTCAHSECEQPLTSPRWPSVMADVAHICGEKPTSPRYDSAMTEDERSDFSNLILLCPNCHRKVDTLEVAKHTVELLRAMKAQHEQACSSGHWASDDQLTGFALLALAQDAPEPADLERVVSRSVKPRTPDDARRLGEALESLREEDPTFLVEPGKDSTTVVSGIGELHCEVIIDRLQREFGVAFDAGDVRVKHLEPIMSLEIVVPIEFSEDVISDVVARRGEVDATEAHGQHRSIWVRAPMSELLGYATDLRSMTSGRATYTLEFSAYREIDEPQA